MTDSTKFNTDAPILRQASRNQRVVAFLVTSLATFATISMTWPLTMRGYQSEAVIQLSDDADGMDLVQTQLPGVLGRVLDQSAMLRRLENLAADSSASQILRSDDIDSINRRISVGVRASTTNRPAQLRVVFLGDGQPDEAEFIAAVAKDIAMMLGSDSIGTSRSLTNDSTSPNYYQLDQADWLVDQVEAGIASARGQAAELVGTARSSENGSAFRNVGHVRQIDASTVDSLHQTLESVDVASLRGVIAKARNNGSVASQNAAVRFDPESVRLIPIGAIPDSTSMLLLMFASLLFGGVVAWNIKPFAATGFNGISDVEELLGVPVVATLGSHDATTNPTPTVAEIGWANHAVRIGGTALVAIAVLGTVFWLLSADVRDSFSQSVFHGFARIVWTMTAA